jgi:hypothetical protein
MNEPIAPYLELTRLAMELSQLVALHPEIQPMAAHVALLAIENAGPEAMQELYSTCLGEEQTIKMRSGDRITGRRLPYQLPHVPMLTPAGVLRLMPLHIAPTEILPDEYDASLILEKLMEGDPTNGLPGLVEVPERLKQVQSGVEDLALDNEILKAEVEGRDEGWDGEQGATEGGN